MIQSEQILEYIDGQLDAESEQELFDTMARQPELRSVLRQFVSIGEAVRADREAYAPPADVERSLMAGLGIAASELGFATGATGIMARLGAMLGGKLWGAVDAFVGGVVLTGLLFALIVTPPTDLADGRATPAGDRTIVLADGRGSAPNSNRPGGSITQGSGTRSSDAASGTAGVASDAKPSASVNPERTATGSSGVGTVAVPHANVSTARVPNASRPFGVHHGIAAHNGISRLPEQSVADHSPSRRASSSSAERSGPELGVQPDGLRRMQSPSDASEARAPSEGVNRPSTSASSTNLRHPVSQPAVPSLGSQVAVQPDLTDAWRPASARTIPMAVPPVHHDDIDRAVMPAGVREKVNSTNPLDVEPDSDNGSSVFAEARGQMGGSLQTSNARADIGTGRTAYAGGAYWGFNKSVAIGLEGGSESYDQTLRYRHGDTLQIDQRPNYFWGGIGLRYTMTDLSFAGAEPFLNVTLGGTSVGPMFRFRVGAQYSITNALGANLSGELSSIQYQFDSQRLYSGRWGLTMGLTYRAW
ncbi:MAG TPA: hypothetical protein VHI13_03165 [Candidatus Kapabacteria bacterium]|nr:hypothetical protein [Candidatus Kapabacteria bacterium]